MPDPRPNREQLLRDLDKRWEHLQKNGTREEQAAFREFMVKQLQELDMQESVNQNFWTKLRDELAKKKANEAGGGDPQK